MQPVLAGGWIWNLNYKYLLAVLDNIDIRNEMLRDTDARHTDVWYAINRANRGEINTIKKVMKDLKISLFEKHFTSHTHKLEH